MTHAKLMLQTLPHRESMMVPKHERELKIQLPRLVEKSTYIFLYMVSFQKHLAFFHLSGSTTKVGDWCLDTQGLLMLVDKHFLCICHLSSPVLITHSPQKRMDHRKNPLPPVLLRWSGIFTEEWLILDLSIATASRTWVLLPLVPNS